MAEKQVAEDQGAEGVQAQTLVVLDLELLDFDDLPRILEIVAASEDENRNVTGTEMLTFVQMIRHAVTSDTSKLKLTHWRAVMAEFGQAMRRMMNPVDEETGKN